jgi:SPP1 gp7 family putative phage head morphogenesis protein
MNYTQQQIDALIEGVFNGSITTRDLPVDLYNAISTKLLSAFGSVEGAPSQSLLNELKENIYMFSGAKVYQQIQDISLLSNVDTIKSFADFKKEALTIYDQYNKNWLQTEYSTAIGQAQMATRWEQIEAQKFELPYLQYNAVIDKNTSDICRPLDGVCLPVSDKFWAINTPLNHFNCRCTVIQFDKTDATQAGITSKENAEKATAEISKKRHPLFEGNSGQDRVIFNKEHPYFDVPKADREFAKENFGLPIPELTSPLKPAVIETWGAVNEQLDNKIFDLLKKEVEITQNGGGCYARAGKVANFSTNEKRWLRSVDYQERVIYHEFGHIIHVQHDLIQTGVRVSREYKNHFIQLKRLIKGSESQIHNALVKLYNTEASNVAVFEKYGVKNLNDLHEKIGATSDSLQALTNNRYGWGHDKKGYWKPIGRKEAEMFAHSVENAFKTNEVFAEIMPEVYKKSIEFVKNIK